MQTNSASKRWAALALFAIGMHVAPAIAQSPSDTPVKIIVPFATGGPTDQLARIIAPPLAAQLGRSVVVENRGGAGGVIGTGMAAKAPADGMTLLLTTSSYVITAGITPKLSYDPRKDMEPVYLLGEVQTMLVARPTLGVNTVAELVAKAKSKDKLSYGSTGVGGTMHIGAELFNKATGTQSVHVPYRGAGPALIDLMGGTVDFLNADVPVLRPYVKDGRIKALAIFDTKRSPLLPDVPTAAEAGFPSLMLSNWYGVMVPAATPPEARARLEAALSAVLQQPDIAARLADGGFGLPRSGAAFKARLNADFDHWIPWLKEARIQAD